MTMPPQAYAYLADHSYGRDESGNAVDLHALVGKRTVVGGVQYKVLAYVDKPSGYQGAIYQRTDTHEIVVAHRGTEFDRQKWADLIKTDGGMVVNRFNQQSDDAIALTKEALNFARHYGERNNEPAPHVTVTGHSLGGTLAQISAHYFGLKGETFNAYGAASLNLRNPATGEIYRLPEGGDAVVNNVMAADLVSSASPQYGQVRVYTNQREIDTLTRSGYDNNRSPLDLRHEVLAAGAAMLGGSHDMHNFLPWDGKHVRDTSILADPASTELTAKYDPMIDKFRADIRADRAAATLLSRSLPGLLEDGIQHFRTPLAPGEPARRAAQHERRGAQLMPEDAAPLPDMRDPAHPANDKYRQAYAGVSGVDRALGRTPDGASERLAASLTAAGAGLSSIGDVTLSRDGSRAFASDGAGPREARLRVDVDVAQAVRQPVEASTCDWQDATARIAGERVQQQALERDAPVRSGPALA